MPNEHHSIPATAPARAIRAEVFAGDAVTAYVRIGRGRPVVMLRRTMAASNASAGSFWDAVMEAVARRCRVVAPENAVGREGFSLWLTSFLDGLGIPRVSLVADGDVAVEAIAFGLSQNDRMERLVLVASDRTCALAIEGVLAEATRGQAVPLLVVGRDAPDDETADRIGSFLGERDDDSRS
jgi:hypothetical protein